MDANPGTEIGKFKGGVLQGADAPVPTVAPRAQQQCHRLLYAWFTNQYRVLKLAMTHGHD